MSGIATPSQEESRGHSTGRDIRQTTLYAEAESIYNALRLPGRGVICDAAELHASRDGRHAVFSGTLMDRLKGAPVTRICRIDLSTGKTQILTWGPGRDRLPKYSPDGRVIAFLSDRHRTGDFQLYLLDAVSGETRSAPPVAGWVEYMHWSPDGRKILLAVAGHGADISGAQGAVASDQADGHALSWMPTVETGDESYRWRSAWVYELASRRVHRVSKRGSNLWEVVWCGSQALAAVSSPGPGEGLWYSGRLHIIDIQTGISREVYSPEDQVGWPAASTSGAHLAFVEAVCSDRWLVAGNLRLIETASGTVRTVDTRGVDVAYTEWCSEQKLLLAGHRGFDTVVALYDVGTGELTELWVSREVTTGGRYVTVSGLNGSGDCVLIGEGFLRAPEVGVIRQGRYQCARTFGPSYADQIEVIGAVEPVSWTAPDGLSIQGWFLRPKGPGPHRLIMNIHGGPVWHWRSSWLGRGDGVLTLMLLKRGYAFFLPNPRGSSGRGQEFARLVQGEMGGADTYDYLSGIEHLTKEGLIDPKRVGVMGHSYGGFMTSWLIGQDSRFAAAVSIAPMINFVTQHLVSNIPDFVPLFLHDDYKTPGGRYLQRSPIMYAHKVRTPTLNICGALDRSAPPEEAVQFHKALIENGVESVLVTYPQEGHGIRLFPAAIDYTARVVSWFEEHV